LAVLIALLVKLKAMRAIQNKRRLLRKPELLECVPVLVMVVAKRTLFLKCLANLSAQLVKSKVLVTTTQLNIIFLLSVLKK
jgi:hypothetical protein